MQKRKPYADYDPCPRPTAWARVKSMRNNLTRLSQPVCNEGIFWRANFSVLSSN